MPQQQPGRRSRLAWALLGLTIALLASGMVIAFTGGEAWPKVVGSGASQAGKAPPCTSMRWATARSALPMTL